MENLSSAVTAQIGVEESKPVQLVEIYLDAGTLRYAQSNSDVVFPVGGDTYSAISFITGNKKGTINGQIVEMDFQFDNRNGALHAYNAAESFQGKQFILKKVFRDALSGTTDYRERINGHMKEPSFDKESMNLKVIDGKALGRRSLNQYYQHQCNNMFGNSRCNKDGFADLTSTTMLANGTADSGSTDYLVDNALTQAVDYWNHGRIEVSISGVTYFRKVNDFGDFSGTTKVKFDVPFHSSVSSCKYAIFKGCPLTWDACKGGGTTVTYGPTENNSANFIGFIHLNENKEEEYGN